MWKTSYAGRNAQASFPHKRANKGEKSIFSMENYVESVEISTFAYAGMHRVFIGQPCGKQP
jgi:hypothetical protein